MPAAAAPYRTTIPGCGTTVAPIVIVGFPTSIANLTGGTITRYVPPQAKLTTTSIIDTVANQTEVIVITPLPGICGEYPFPHPPSPTGADPTPTPEVCPTKGCSDDLDRGATIVIEAINRASLQSQFLQNAAERIDDPPASDEEFDTGLAQGVIADVARGLNNIAEALTTSIPRFAFLPAFLPGCDTDTVVFAFVEFVHIHQQLLNVLIGRAALLEGGPLKPGEEDSGAVVVYERDVNAFIGRVIAKALRAVGTAVDTLAFKLNELAPTRVGCVKQESAKLSASLKEAIASYDG